MKVSSCPRKQNQESSESGCLDGPAGEQSVESQQPQGKSGWQGIPCIVNPLEEQMYNHHETIVTSLIRGQEVAGKEQHGQVVQIAKQAR